MSLAVVVLVVAVAVATAAGGSWRRVARLPLRQLWLVVAAIGAQVGGAALGLLGVAGERPSYVAGLALSAVFAFAFCARNVSVPGVPLVSAGLACNALVVALNGAMPVSIVAAYHARVPIAAISAGTDPRHDIAGIGTTLRWLGDVVPVPLPVRPEVVSVGDVLVTAGLAELVVVGMTGGTLRASRRRPGGGGVMGWGGREERHHGEEGP